MDRLILPVAVFPLVVIHNMRLNPYLEIPCTTECMGGGCMRMYFLDLGGVPTRKRKSRPFWSGELLCIIVFRGCFRVYPRTLKPLCWLSSKWVSYAVSYVSFSMCRKARVLCWCALNRINCPRFLFFSRTGANYWVQFFKDAGIPTSVAKRWVKFIF